MPRVVECVLVHRHNFIMGWVEITKYLSRFHQDYVSHCKSVAFQARIMTFVLTLSSKTLKIMFFFRSETNSSNLKWCHPQRNTSSSNGQFTRETSLFTFQGRKHIFEKECNFLPYQGTMAVKNAAVQPYCWVVVFSCTRFR